MSKGSSHTTWAPPPPVAPTVGAPGRRGAGKNAHLVKIRAERALELLSEGRGYRQVVAELVKEFAVSTRTGERDCQRAQKLLLEEHVAERPHRRARLEARLERLSRVSEEAGDYGSAIRAIQVLGKWHGFEELKVTAGFDPAMEAVLAMRPIERERRIAELLAKREAGGAAPPPAPETEPEQPTRPAPFDPASRARRRR